MVWDATWSLGGGGRLVRGEEGCGSGAAPGARWLCTFWVLIDIIGITNQT